MILFRAAPPTPKAFTQLRAQCGWGEISPETAEKALEKSVFDLTCFDGDNLVGMGRVVGDGVLYFYLQDIIVKPTYQGQQIGRKIVARLTEEALSRAQVGATIGLMSAKGKEDFYGHFGFQKRPSAQLGAGMTRFVLPR